MKTLVLSDRMKAITDMVTYGNSVCDVGCDHGYVSIYLVLNKAAKKAIAMDVRTGPLALAKEHIREYHLENQIETRCSDGLEKIAPFEAESCVIAGMGGNLMAAILKSEEEKARSFQELILQPQSQLEEFRFFLRKEGYKIIEENMIFEEGKYYPMMKVLPGKASCQEQPINEYKSSDKVLGEVCEKQLSQQKLYDQYGEYLLKQRHPVLEQYLRRTYEMNQELSEHLKAHPSEKTKERAIALVEEQKSIELALTTYFV